MNWDELPLGPAPDPNSPDEIDWRMQCVAADAIQSESGEPIIWLVRENYKWEERQHLDQHGYSHSMCHAADRSRTGRARVLDRLRFRATDVPHCN